MLKGTYLPWKWKEVDIHMNQKIEIQTGLQLVEY